MANVFNMKTEELVAEHAHTREGTIRAIQLASQIDWRAEHGDLTAIAYRIHVLAQ